MTPSTDRDRRLHALDTLRGVAALSIVFWHWQHFFAIETGSWPEHWERTSQPFFVLFRPLYDQGWAAVDLFFPLSGFIFFWLYGEGIRLRRIGAGQFAILRLSRLYPLHFATLLIAALLQVLFYRKTGNFFIYTDNNWAHFLPSLIMAQQWLPPNLDQSFNGPAWSVSVEMLLYGLFFVAMRAGLSGPRLSLLIAAAAIPLLSWNWFIARGVMGFFIGGAAYHICENAKSHARARTIAYIVGVAAAVAWALVLIEIYFNPLHAFLYWAAGHISPEVGRLYIGWNGWLFLVLFISIVSPLTIMALALHEQVLGGRYGRLSFLGDISYSTYLLHFPLQLALAILALSLGIPPGWFQSPFAMAAFFAVLIGLGTLSYRYFERPMQAYIRGLKVPRLFPAE